MRSAQRALHASSYHWKQPMPTVRSATFPPVLQVVAHVSLCGSQLEHAFWGSRPRRQCLAILRLPCLRIGLVPATHTCGDPRPDAPQEAVEPGHILRMPNALQNADPAQLSAHYERPPD
mmetsp:Transcript_12273/g.33698  ORF Transcript_12273/g.33698 Transcript_12273/m.33698 type:complete len:119 (+) Transcript_12273:195-551(+)|eukprot:CAMPEP_0194512662 /NCGR_PEP_ID=MMETSP0253-20130528/44730_1 /TAXON_ID=2966 /ORGANISM="Noctiluca scintillans" /LENGTH=118 /DNA_ID=CAMNT_0039356143 /DNA_START=167 /DNA_END=523 /DNA_ORIENTATION=+